MKRKGTKIFEEFKKFLRKHDINGRESSNSCSFWHLKHGFVVFFEENNVMKLYDYRIKGYRYFRVKSLSCVFAILCNPHFSILNRSFLQGFVMPDYDYYEIQPPSPKSYFCCQSSGGVSPASFSVVSTLVGFIYVMKFENEKE